MGTNEKPNIIFIVMDAVRARNLGCYGYDKPTSPNIDRLAKDGVLFENAFSCINTTDSSLTSIFSGMYPRTHGIIHQGDTITKYEINKFLKGDIKLLPEILKENGYYTIGLDWLGRWHKRGYDYYMGIKKTRKKIVKMFFSKFINNKFFKNQHIYKLMRLVYENRKSINVEWENAKELTDTGIKLLEKIANNEIKMPFFMFIHYWDTHIPYSPPYKYISELGNYKPLGKTTNEILSEINNPARVGYLKGYFKEDIDVSEIVRRYDGAIKYIDAQIGRLLNFLSDYGMLDNTMIIITSDHGESLIEHGIYFDHHGLYDVSIHVPIIIWYPNNLPKNKRVNSLVQHIDLLPTIDELLNIETGINYDGLNLLPIINDEIDKIRTEIYIEEAYTQRKFAIRTEQYKYIFADNIQNAKCRFCNKIHGSLEELFNLYDDPDEKYNVLHVYDNIYKILRNKLNKWINKTYGTSKREILKLNIKNIKKKRKI